MPGQIDQTPSPVPQGEIVATGEEIRCGALVDSNSAWLAERLEGLGLHVQRITAVGDDAAALADLLQEIGRRSDTAVITGGLGPTPDDVTAEAVSQGFDQALVLNERALEQIEGFFAARERRMPPSNRKQAMIPSEADLIENPRGTAPGFSLTIAGCRFYFLPGVPGEMKAMFTRSVVPDLAERLGERARPRSARTLRTFGLTESGAADRLEGFQEVFPKVGLSYRASFPEIQVTLSMAGQGADGGQAQLEQASLWVAERLGPAVFSADGRALEQVVGDLLRSRQAGLAVAESCTGGLISHLITSIPGSSDYFLLSAVTYANDAKIDLLGISPNTLAEHGAVSEEIAREMASGIKKRAGATFGLSTTGIAGPGGGTAEKPVGTVCIGLAGPSSEEARSLSFRFGQREHNTRVFAVAALDLLRRRMLDQSGNAG